MTRNINVLVISRMYPSSAKPISGTFVHDQVLALSAHEHCRITVICPKPYVPAVVRTRLRRGMSHALTPREENIDGIPVFYPKVLSFGGDSFHIMKGLSMPWTLRPFMREFRAAAFDIIHAHMSHFHEGWFAKEINKTFGKKTVLTIHGGAGIDPPRRSRKFFMRKTLESADRIIAVSDSIKAKILQYGLDERKVTVIGNGAFPAMFHPMDKTRARQLLGLPAEARIIVSVATLMEAKGLRELISALSEVKKSVPRVLLILIGADIIKNDLMRQADDLGVTESVLFAGSQPHDKIPLWLNASEVFVLPSHQEGMPVSLLEALMCGKPVVATAVGGITGILTSRDYGILVEPRNVGQLSRALLEALGKDWREERIAGYGRRFSWDAAARKIRAVYEDLLA